MTGFLRPAVSVCIPAYNGSRFIAASIESVLAQTMQDFELVVIDDASSDGTLDIVRQFKDERIRLFCNPANTGIGTNWNRAVRECRGRHIKLLCQDDLLYVECLARQAAVLDDQANADVALVCARRDIIDQNDRIVLRGRGLFHQSGRVESADAIRRIVRSGTNAIGEPAAVMFRAEAYGNAGGFDGSNPYMIDLDCWCRLLRLGSLYVLPETLCAFRVSRTALSTTLARFQSKATRQFLKQLARRSPHAVRSKDLFIGQIKATLLGMARRLLYHRLWDQSAGR